MPGPAGRPGRSHPSPCNRTKQFLIPFFLDSHNSDLQSKNLRNIKRKQRVTEDIDSKLTRLIINIPSNEIIKYNFVLIDYFNRWFRLMYKKTEVKSLILSQVGTC